MASQCKDCGADMKWPRCHRCERCQYSHLMANRGRDSTTSYPQLAHRYVARAIALGDIPALDGSVLCVDCEQPAAHYDHRDYARPLQVEPVCVSCNARRGPALNGGTPRSKRGAPPSADSSKVA